MRGRGFVMSKTLPDHLWYLCLQPNEHDKVPIKYDAAIAPEVLSAQADKQALISKTMAFADIV